MMTPLSMLAALLGQGGPADYSWIGIMVLIGVMFYMLIVRPEQKKRKDQEQDIQSLKKNDRIITVGGIYGTVVNVQQDDRVVIRVDDNSNTKLQISRTAVGRVLRDKKDESAVKE